MPKIVSVKSLGHICVDFIANNIDSFPKESLPSELEVIDSEKVPFYFEELPASVLEELVKTLRKQEAHYRQFINLLIVSKLDTLDLSKCNEEGFIHNLSLAAKNSPNLTSLVISGHHYVEDYFNLIQTFTKLQILDISNTSTQDNFLNLLGSSCKELRELYASNCALTDAGIEGLCVVGHCKSIRFLNLIGTKVTHRGIAMSLEYLPYLRELKHPSTIRVLTEIHQRELDLKLSVIPKFPLFSMKVLNITPNRNLNLGSAVFLCPFITSVTIDGHLEKLTDKDLLSLLPLEKLEDLNISGYGNVNLTFDGGIAPFLKARGNSLNKLTLSMVHEVDHIPIITQYCSNLRYLNLCYVHSFLRSWSASQRDSFRRQRNKLEQPILKYLERLNLTEPNGILPESLCLLLSSPVLNCVRIQTCDTFTDDVLQQAANLHSFRYLESFEMHDCKLATTKILQVLLQETIPLNWIRLTWEQKEPENLSEILHRWEKEKEKKHWNICILVQYFDCEDTDTSDVDSENEDIIWVR